MSRGSLWHSSNPFSYDSPHAMPAYYSPQPTPRLPHSPMPGMETAPAAAMSMQPGSAQCLVAPQSGKSPLPDAERSDADSEARRGRPFSGTPLAIPSPTGAITATGAYPHPRGPLPTPDVHAAAQQGMGAIEPGQSANYFWSADNLNPIAESTYSGTHSQPMASAAFASPPLPAPMYSPLPFMGVPGAHRPPRSASIHLVAHKRRPSSWSRFVHPLSGRRRAGSHTHRRHHSPQAEAELIARSDTPPINIQTAQTEVLGHHIRQSDASDGGRSSSSAGAPEHASSSRLTGQTPPVTHFGPRQTTANERPHRPGPNDDSTLAAGSSSSPGRPRGLSSPPANTGTTTRPVQPLPHRRISDLVAEERGMRPRKRSGRRRHTRLANMHRAADMSQPPQSSRAGGGGPGHGPPPVRGVALEPLTVPHQEAPDLRASAPARRIAHYSQSQRMARQAPLTAHPSTHGGQFWIGSSSSLRGTALQHTHSSRELTRPGSQQGHIMPRYRGQGAEGLSQTSLRSTGSGGKHRIGAIERRPSSHGSRGSGGKSARAASPVTDDKTLFFQTVGHQWLLSPQASSVHHGQGSGAQFSPVPSRHGPDSPAGSPQVFVFPPASGGYSESALVGGGAPRVSAYVPPSAASMAGAGAGVAQTHLRLRSRTHEVRPAMASAPMAGRTPPRAPEVHAHEEEQPCRKAD